jgi:UDP-N-acetylglucosamine 2-epimerase (non-hydrolysing)
VQTARIMERLEPVLEQHRPDWLLVYGDVNSTMAAAIVAAKLGVAVAHVEAGLRSGDRAMPEEINRLVTDRLASLLLTPSRDADETLRSEGEPDQEIVFVGNVMIDSLLYVLPAARRSGARTTHGITDSSVLVTLHRPSNVDDPERLASIIEALRKLAVDRTVLFPVHPRTRQRLQQQGIFSEPIRMTEPLGYLEMIDVIDAVGAVVTDSGGIQEETTALGIPCFTLRENTERPITITEGTNQLVSNPSTLPALVSAAKRPVEHRAPEGWDGKAGERIIEALRQRAPSGELA